MPTTTYPTVTLTGRPADGGKLLVFAGLTKLDGNPLAYFSLTCAGYDARGRETFGGADHVAILAHFPELAPIAALHLADENGVPLYAAENGAYHLGFSADAAVKYDVFARLWRVDEQHAREARREILRAPDAVGVTEREQYRFAVEKLTVLMRSMTSRWQAEADAGRALIERLAEEEA